LPQRAARDQRWLRALHAAVACVLATSVVPTAIAAASAPFPVIGQRAPDFLLIDQDDRGVRVSQFRGKLVLLNFIYTHCTDVCPLTTAALARAQRELAHRAGGRRRSCFSP
jgi:protein SCO1/2